MPKPKRQKKPEPLPVDETAQQLAARVIERLEMAHGWTLADFYRALSVARNVLDERLALAEEDGVDVEELRGQV